MSVSNYNRSLKKPGVSTVADINQSVRLRIKLSIPQQSQQTAVLSQLVTDYGLSVNILCTVLDADHQPKQFDLELRGTIAQVNDGLSYLESLDALIKGKPNPDGDSWYY